MFRILLAVMMGAGVAVGALCETRRHLPGGTAQDQTVAAAEPSEIPQTLR